MDEGKVVDNFCRIYINLSLLKKKLDYQKLPIRSISLSLNRITATLFYPERYQFSFRSFKYYLLKEY